MRLKVEHSHLYVNLEFGRQFFWIEDVFFVFRFIRAVPNWESAGGMLFIFLLTNYVMG